VSKRSKKEKAAGRERHRQLKRAKKMKRKQKKSVERLKSRGNVKNSLSVFCMFREIVWRHQSSLSYRTRILNVHEVISVYFTNFLGFLLNLFLHVILQK